MNRKQYAALVVLALVAGLVGGMVSSAFAGQVKFNVCFAVGESVVLASNGPLAFRADCTAGPELFVFGSSATPDTKPSNGPPGGPGDIRRFFALPRTGACDSSGGSGAMVSSAGHYLGIDGDIMIQCTDILGCDCSATGFATKFRTKLK